MITTIIFVAILGAMVGSFLNVVILRTHKSTASWTKGRSYCVHCTHTLAWYDLVPIVSYLFLVGRCRYCKKKISIQYPLVEFTTAVLFVLAYIFSVDFTPLTGGISWHQLALLGRNVAVVCIMVILFVYDFRWQLIPDQITLPAIGFFFIINVFLLPVSHVCSPLSMDCYPLDGWTSALLGAILGGGFFLLQFVISKGKWIGGGDIRLGALMGVILGLSGTFFALLGAYMIGALWGIALIVFKKKQLGSAIPFGTFLSVTTIIVLLWYPQIMSIARLYFFL
ncbi:MAG: prepilin peptidase [bacterium]|nr:prepilin peptidase [bacterium]